MAKIIVQNTEMIHNPISKGSNPTPLENHSNSRGLTQPDCYPADAGARGEQRKESVEIRQPKEELQRAFEESSKKEEEVKL